LQVDISDAEVARAPVRGILTVVQGEASVSKVLAELKHLFVGLTWDWKIKQLNAKEFLKNFPSDEVRSQISTCKSFDFETSQIKASVVETGITEEAVDELVAVWVKIYGIPKMARSEDYIKSIVELVGEFEAVEIASIRRDGPVRVRVACKDPRELHFSIHLYINKAGYMIRWEPKGYLPYENRQNPPDDDDKDDKDDEGLEDDMNLDDEFKNHDISRGRPLKGEGSQHESRAGAFSAPPTYKGKVSSEQGGSIKRIASKKTSLLKHPDLFENYTSLVIWGDKKQEMIAEQESQELEAPELSQNETRPEFSTLLEFDEDLERCQIPTDSDIERLRGEEDREEEDSFQEVSNRKKGKAKRTKPAITSRMSLRHRDLAAVPVPKRAEILTQKKNLESTGNSNPFAIFQLIDNEDLLKIASASHISLGKNRDEIDRNIDSIKAKELVQAKLSELRWKQEKERVDAQRVIDDAGCVIDQDETVVVPDGDENDGFSSPELKRRWGSKTKKKK
jgi:hypothetical protein